MNVSLFVNHPQVHHTSVIQLWCITKTVDTTLTSLGGRNVTSCSSLHHLCNCWWHRSIACSLLLPQVLQKYLDQDDSRLKRRKFSQRPGLVLSLSPLPEVEGLLLWDRSGLGMHSSIFVYSTSGSERWHIERESRWSVGALRVHWSPIYVARTRPASRKEPAGAHHWVGSSEPIINIGSIVNCLGSKWKLDQVH